MSTVKRVVVVAGNIGVGKSTLVNLLCDRLDWSPFYEPHQENPYLEDFYGAMKRWGFHSQVFFLTQRARIHQQLFKHPTSVVQDRCLYEDAEVFACNLYKQGSFAERDYRTYLELYEVLAAFLPPPDLIIYLRASVSTLQGRIAQRGRDYEQEIAASYLAQLQELYEAWVSNFTICPVLTVPADDLDYVANPRHLDLIVQKVQEKLSGKEEVRF
ncbi:MAG: deoxynucleoside kinase [Anaerolineales bacterium]|nr:deoxynucleoside kinase [Anaerolineales bacterium]